MRAGITAPATLALVIDPNIVSEDGSVSLSQWAPSPDAKLLAYGLAEGGADWNTVRVRDIPSGKDLSDEVRWMRFSNISWTNDSKGFYYSRYPEPPKNKVLEAALSGRALVLSPDRHSAVARTRWSTSERIFRAWIINVGDVTEDGRYLLVVMFEGAENKNRLYYADLVHPNAPKIEAPIKPLVEANDAEYAPIGSKGSNLYLRSDKDAPNRKVVAVDLNNPPSPAAWKTIIPRAQGGDRVLVAVIGGRVVAPIISWTCRAVCSFFDLDGTPQGEVALPGAGAVGVISGREDAPDIWYNFSSPLMPSTVYVFNPVTKENT